MQYIWPGVRLISFGLKGSLGRPTSTIIGYKVEGVEAANVVLFIGSHACFTLKEQDKSAAEGLPSGTKFTTTYMY